MKEIVYEFLDMYIGESYRGVAHNHLPIRQAANKMFNKYINEEPNHPFHYYYKPIMETDRKGYYMLDMRLTMMYMTLKYSHPERAYNIYNYFLMKIGDYDMVKN
jgi:hypothetical protein